MEVAKRVVSIGAHSLDAELLGGPLLLKYAKAGSHCTCIHVTQGRLEDPDATEEAKKPISSHFLNRISGQQKHWEQIQSGLDMYPATCLL